MSDQTAVQVSPPAKRWTARFGELTVGHVVNLASVWAFDFLLYPVVIHKAGLLRGGAIMSVVSFIVCLISLWFYDWSGRDWLGIEAIKSLKTYEGTRYSRRLLAWILRRGDAAACLALSIKFDPFITVTYLRKGAFNGMSGRDWRIFVASWLIGNVYWASACFTGLALIERLWQVCERAVG